MPGITVTVGTCIIEAFMIKGNNKIKRFERNVLQMELQKTPLELRISETLISVSTLFLIY